MFPTTRWTLIRQASTESTDDSRKALEELCQQYAGPVFAFIRRRVSSHESAEDATQEFFSKLINGTLLSRADRDHGRFRAFLLHAVRAFLADLHDYDNAIKRGGQVQHVSLQSDAIPQMMDHVTPEHEFELQWIRSLLHSALVQLQNEYRQTGREELFETLKTALDDGRHLSAHAAGQQLRMTEAAVRVALHRLRKRLGELIRQHIRDSVATADDVDDEFNKLMHILETNR